MNDRVLIGIADTLLHVTTETTNLDQISTTGTSIQSYGRKLPQYCALRNTNGTRLNCVISVPPINSTALPYLFNPSETYDVLSNASSSNKVMQAEFQGQNLSYLAPSTPIPILDFKATTIASYSQCHSATKECHANSTNYHCSSLFNTTTADKGWYLSKSSGNIISLGIFPDSQLINASFTSLPNPFHTIAQISIYAGNTPGRGVDTIEIREGNHTTGGREFFLRCTTSFFDVTYTSINNTVTIQKAVPITDQDIIYSLAEINVQGRDGYVYGQILGGALTAFHQNTSAGANKAFASQYDATFLAGAASIIETVPNLEQQTRTMILATRVHRWALLALIGTLLVSALFGFLMVLLALSASQSPNPSQEDHALTPKPNDPLLQPPSIEDVFEEYVDAKQTDRLGIFKTKQGDWEYVCRTPESKTLEAPDTTASSPIQVIPKQPGETPDQGLGLFGIPLVKFGAGSKSLSDSVSELSDEEEDLAEVSLGGQKEKVPGEYRAL